MYTFAIMTNLSKDPTLAVTKRGVVPQTEVIFLLVFNVILELVQGHERGILGPMKDTDIAVYKSFLLKLS